MDEYIAETFELRGYTVKLIQDQDAENPRKGFDNFGTMVCFHSRYDLGDERHRESPDEFLMALAEEFRPGLEDWIGNGLWRKTVKGNNYDSPTYKAQKKLHQELADKLLWSVLEKHYLILPLYLYDHSGITMSTGRFSDPWDSGQVGWIYCTKKKAVEEFGKKVLTKAVREKALKYLESEVETYDQYLTGDVYGYVIENSDGDDVDSCWGFFGLDYRKKEAIDNVPDEPCLAGGEGADEAMEATLA